MSRTFVRIIKWVLLIGVGLALVGCGDDKKTSGRVKVIVPWPQEDGHYDFKEVHLTTLGDPSKMEGGAARIHYDTLMTTHGFEGPVARPKLGKTSGGVYFPLDAGSSQVVSTYAYLDYIYNMDRRLDPSQSIPWPLNVGVKSQVSSSRGLYEQNALYYYPTHSIAVAPSTAGTPMASSLGVIIHEKCHADFKYFVRDPVGLTEEKSDLSGAWGEKPFQPQDFFSIKSRIYSPVKLSRYFVSERIEELNFAVLRAWDEGLADICGFTISGDPQFVGRSVEQVRTQRDLGLPPSSFKPSLDLERDIDLYNLGTQVARFLTQKIGKNPHFTGVTPQESREKLYAFVRSRYAHIAKYLQNRFYTEELKSSSLFIALFGGTGILSLDQDCPELGSLIVDKTERKEVMDQVCPGVSL